MSEARDMLNVLFQKPELFRQRSVWSKAWMLPLALLIGVGQAQAQTSTCFRSRDLTPSSNWTMAPSGSVFKNGDIVGRTSAYAQFYLPIEHGNTVYLEASGQATNNIYNAVPLSGMPGLGLVVRWAGYTSTSALTPVGPVASPGTILSNQNWFSVLRARTQSSYTLSQYYTFELVIIDEKIYKGGKLTFTEANKVMVITANQKGTANPQMCVNGFVDPMAALTGTVQVPELPKPVLPTCKFSPGTLNQRVPLGPVDPGQVVPIGSARSSGAEGQATFQIEATGCSKNAKMDIYFTDARDSATTKDYVVTTNSAVGIRMFYRGEYEPMPFGPAPSGSWVPQRYAASLGPAASEGASLAAGFTAQYVRLQNKTEADIKPGPLEAAAVFVIVYP